MLDDQSPHDGPGGDPAPDPPQGSSPRLQSAHPAHPAHQGAAAHNAPRSVVWSLAALLCLVAGAVGSLLGAHDTARSDAANARGSFHSSATEIAAATRGTIQHEEDLLTTASTFYAGNADASPREFHAWATWARASRLYPELQELRLLALVPPAELAAFKARVSGHVSAPEATTTALIGRSARPAATAAPREQCLAVAAFVRNAAASPPAGIDYCAHSAALLSSRDSGASIYARASLGTARALRVDVPVYRGPAPPVSLVGRRAAFAGWVQAVFVPGVAIQQILRAHPGIALHLAYRSGRSTVVFAGGGAAPASGAQSETIPLHNGWTVRSIGTPLDAGVLADVRAREVLITGLLVSALLALLVFLLGASHIRPPARARERRPGGDPQEPALYDALTGLPGRALMLDLATRAIARVGRQSGVLAGALVIDVDWFSDVNDKLGQAAGDQLLKIVADRLQAVVRAEDTVGRLEGDRFVVLVEAAARGARLDALARRVIESMHKPVELEGFGPSFHLTASIGVAFGRYSAPEDLLRDAQLALDAAKAAGRDGYTVFNANMHSVIEGRGVLEAELNTALLEDQFVLLYQPVRDLSNQRVVALEALIRWQHPTQGLLAPEDFIPLAEETGLIVPIGRWALEEACRRAAAWNVAGYRVGISVMVSANQLNRDGFATDVRRALQQSGIEAARLTLEVAESTIMHDVAVAAERLREVKQLGVSIAIDDFGSGYAYRSDLQRMPLDYLKVDRSCLASAEDEDYRNWLLEAILLFGRDLSLTVIAKGIETEEQLAALQRMGCTLAQGFFLGEPAAGAVVENMLAGQRAAHDAASTSPLG